MTFYLPSNVMKTILSFCDDRKEVEQKKAHSKCLAKINRLEKDWYGRYLEEAYVVDGTDAEDYEWGVAMNYNEMIEERTDESQTFEENIECATLRNILFDEDYLDHKGINTLGALWFVSASTDHGPLPIDEVQWVDYYGYVPKWEVEMYGN